MKFTIFSQRRAQIASAVLTLAIHLAWPVQAGATGTTPVGAFTVQPGGSRLIMSVTAGEAPNEIVIPYDNEDSGSTAQSQLNFVDNHILSQNISGGFGDHSASSTGSLEVHVSTLSVGGLRCTISGSVNAEVFDSNPPIVGSPNAQSLADTYFLLSEQNAFYDWTYVCHAHINDQSDAKNQAHVWVYCDSSINSGATPSGIPTNLVLGGLATNDGHGPSAQQDADISLSGTSVAGTVFNIAPRIQVEAKQSNKPVEITLSITLELHRTSGRCCVPNNPFGSCFITTASDCGSFAGSLFKGVDTDCSTALCTGTSEIHWASAAGGSYDDATKWNPQSVPASDPSTNPPKSDIAVFDLSGGYTVTFPGPVTSEIALVRNGLPTFLNANYQLKALSPTEQALQIGAGATLTLQNCPSLSLTHGIVGDLLPGTSTLNVFDSNLFATGTLGIGDLAPGKLNIAGNALASSADSRVGSLSPGDVIVDGTDAKWIAGSLAVGLGAAGTLKIQGGGNVTASNAFIGYHNGATNAVGDVTVNGVSSGGDSSKFKVDNKLTVGELGIGTLTISNKGAGSFKDVTLAEFGSTSGTIKVTGPPAPNSPKLDVSGAIIVGKNGIGDLKIDGGAQASCHSVILAQNPGSKGTVTVSDADTLLGTGTENLVIGGHAAATFNILDGAKVATAKAIVGNLGSATVLVKNGPAGGEPAWRISGDLEMSSSGNSALTVENAFVHVLGKLSLGFANGSCDILLTSSGQLKVDQNSNIGSHGQILGSGLYACPFTQVIAPGKIDPGIGVAGSVQVIKAKLPDAKHALFENAVSDGIGTLTVDGDLQFDEGSILHIDVRGAADGQHDVLHVTGTATFNGTLEVNFIDGFVPQPGQIIAFLQIDGATIGQFSEIKFLGLPEGFAAEGRFINGALEVGGSSPAPLPAGICGIGLCGAGMMPLVSAMLIGHSLRRLRRAVPRRIR